MPNLTQEQQKILDRYNEIIKVLGVPTPGQPLPNGRKWGFPPPDNKALADHPQPQEKARTTAQTAQTSQASESEKKETEQTSDKNSPKKTGGK